MKKVIAFDLGKASIGYCVRDGFDIKEVSSIIIDKDHAEVISNRDRRRVKKTLDAHRKREQFFNQILENCGLTIPSTELLTKEFGNKNETNIYNSTLLRIALLQNKTLEEWQIYKAIHSAIQRRGYDSNLPWANANSKTSDDEENEKLAVKYTQENEKELISNDEYKYPCYYDAVRLGLWEETSPEVFKRCISISNSNKVRTTGLVAPRKLVEKELIKLWENAQKQLPQLNKISVEYFLYGEYETAYGSYTKKEFKQYRGTEKDAQGVLGQKIPRFDNRIIMKCKLLPKRNVSKAATIENITFTLLMKLKNLRLNTVETVSSGDKRRLSPAEIKEILETKRDKDNWEDKLLSIKEGKNPTFTITKTDIEAVIGKKSILDKPDSLKLQANISGRSSFCRRACAVMNKIIMTGELYPQEMDVSEFVDRPNTSNGITEDEIREMLSKIGDWNNLYIPDNRNELAQLSADTREKTDLLIGNITNPIVRNRLQIFRDLLLKLKHEHGTPDEVIFEFVRDGADRSLLPGKKASDLEREMKKQEKYNEQLAQELKDVEAYSAVNFDKLKLLKSQDMRCIYSGKSIGIADLSKCEIDHIYPRTMGGNDALYNRVLCYAIENQNKGGRTPYEWLKCDENKWEEYYQRVSNLKSKLGKKKFELLTGRPESCKELIDSYNGLAETAQIARVAQKLTGVIFGWGLQTQGHIFVNNGSSTSAIRRRYGLNKLLGDDVKKNRDNDKHHALDAICISFSRDFKYNKELKADVIEGFTYDMVKKAIEPMIPYPYANDKPFKGNTKPLETIYGYREKDGKACVTSRVDITSIKQKETAIKSIVDEVIKNDLLNQLEYKLSSKEWEEMLKAYVHPKKQTKVKKVLTIVSEGKLEKDSNGHNRIGEFADFGCKGVKNQFKHSKGHKGQILYYNEKGSIKVMPIYANQKISDVKEKLINMGCKLYNRGQMFYSGCLLDIPEDFKAGSVTHPAGVYKLRTIESGGPVKIENNCGLEIRTNVIHLVNANFKKLSK